MKHYAVKLSPESISMISVVNGGVRPHLYSSTYFITTDDANGHNDILGAKAFFDKYEFVEPEKADEFVEVREK